jgi:hypothetical protein
MTQRPIDELRISLLRLWEGDLFAHPVPVPQGTRYQELGLSPDASNEDVRWATSDMARRLKADQLQQRVEEVHGWDLDKPEKRSAYDCANPPLALLKLEDAGVAALTDPRVRLFLLRREISEFLLAKGAAVFHPSDLTRRDFSDDFSRNPILDAE